jgi:DeoR/GlpR family transcriptional regulator of sugar metabolism
MIGKERQAIIMDRLNQNGFVSVQELMKDLKASRSSVMRDLISLEEEGLLVREHGGASLENARKSMNKISELPVFEKETLQAQAKLIVCHSAAEQIEEGDCIFIDSGTTAAFLLSYLPKKNITKALKVPSGVELCGVSNIYQVLSHMKPKESPNSD